MWLPCLLDEEIQDLLERKNLPCVSISADKKIQPIPDKNGEGFICAFLNAEDNKCKIYAFRPLECQLYPFLINLRGKKVFLTVDLNCPYIKEHLNDKAFKEYAEYLADFLNSCGQIKILKDNPQIIQAYEEVSDIIELKLLDETK